VCSTVHVLHNLADCQPLPLVVLLTGSTYICELYSWVDPVITHRRGKSTCAVYSWAASLSLRACAVPAEIYQPVYCTVEMHLWSLRVVLLTASNLRSSQRGHWTYILYNNVSVKLWRDRSYTQCEKSYKCIKCYKVKKQLIHVEVKHFSALMLSPPPI
jgi:hypothetical protein